MRSDPEVQSKVSTLCDGLDCCRWFTVLSEVHSHCSCLPGTLNAAFSYTEIRVSFFCRTCHLLTLLKVPPVGSVTMVLL